MHSISIIIPIYNVERYISQCAHSLFRQTQSDIEYIFVNDCTPDNSIKALLDVLKNYPNRTEQVKILNHERNRGLAAARQSGLDEANGEYIIMIDSDDWTEADMIAKMYSKAKENNADIVIADYYLNYPHKEIYVPQRVPNNGKDCIKEFFMANLIGSSCNKLVRRSLYIDNNIIYFEGLNMWEDLVTSVQLCFFTNRISYLPLAFLHYRQVVNSYTHVMSEKSLQNMIDAITFFDNFFRNHNVYEEFEKTLCYEKLSVKLNLLLNSKGELQRERNSFYIETHKIIMNHANISIFWRIALLFASLGMLPVFNFMAWMGKKINKL